MRIAVIGAGSFGQNHLRVVSQSPRAKLVAAVDLDAGRAAKAAEQYSCQALTDWREVASIADAAIIATPTTTHAEIGCGLLEAGLHCLVEKPITPDLDSANRLIDAAHSAGRVLAVGHLERFNPAVMALREVATLPLFFEIHRMNLFQPRSLDVDVVLDLMIHDLDIVLMLVGAMPEEVRAAGIRILSERVDIANVRLAFANGCIANITASRVSTERVRKLRLFQPHQYISIDYGRQDGVVISMGEQRQIGFCPLAVTKQEPLAAQLETFLDAMEGKPAPIVTGKDALAALEVSLDILAKIEKHAEVVNRTLAGSNLGEAPGVPS